ncbi:tetratricopeptide repeat protein [Belnapia rosea]|uniref:Sel1 repeat-containing protein n=1 Tax=Belnapia rosea TaxID=938405 RepID=A0A1G6V9J0_9PROT|nr:tetratricopeptide repeat protein [Belnapia rosea]SDD49505.1 Sel1 repeat-containing protein [Belnapia rosea]
MSEIAKKYDPGIYGELGKWIAQGDKKAFDLVLDRANNGEGYAQLEVGFAYANGFCVQKDNRRAAEWYEKAASQGVLNAQFNLGCLHYLGLGQERSVQNALHWFSMAAEGGHAQAQRNLAPMRMEAHLVAEETAHWKALGVNKAPGIVKYELAHQYLSELKEMVADPDIRSRMMMAATDGRIPVDDFDRLKKAFVLVYNISSATPLPIEKVVYCAINNDWEPFESMPKSGLGP